MYAPAQWHSLSALTCIGDIFRPSFDMLCKRLKDRLTVKLSVLPVISGRNDKYMIVTDLKWQKKIVYFCMFPDLRDNSSDFSVVDRLSIVTSGRIGPLPLLIFARC